MFIIMMNLLISIVGDSYEVIKSQEEIANGYERFLYIEIQLIFIKIINYLI